MELKLANRIFIGIGAFLCLVGTFQLLGGAPVSGAGGLIVFGVVMIIGTLLDAASNTNRRSATEENSPTRQDSAQDPTSKLEENSPPWQHLAQDPSSKFAAIKAYRDHHKCELFEAKKAVDEFLTS